MKPFRDGAPAQQYRRNLEQALRQSEIRFEETEEGIYRLIFQGQYGQDLLVGIRVSDKWMQSYCLFTRNITERPDGMLLWMLKQNHLYPSVKFCLNPNDDILLQNDLEVEAIDVRRVQASLQALINAADQLYHEFIEHDFRSE